ncbi:unnamed protein product [Heligmosomoides polygyrus]|uniref:G_PROTEIN_RECEP_F1_2 domain-containing protein n=1 Tax=Heligmosomoides polygyrus TaxID=6339 RepID=A0A3P7XQ93_HELPZ|nr:unnamed protein product [Heligmosomoides polygyrus]
MGAYKYLMISFALCNILYASTEFISKPDVHIYANTYMAYSRGFLKHEMPWGFLSLCVFIGMYGMNTALLATHFIYRYILLCRLNLHFILTQSISGLVAGSSVLFWGFTYGSITYYCFCATEEFYRYAGPNVQEILHEDIRELSLFCVFAYEVIQDTAIIYWRPTIGLFIMVVMMSVSFTVMVLCGIMMCRTLRKTTMSKKSKSVQKQLLKALVVQAIVPFLMSYLPRFAMFFFVLMGYPAFRIYTLVPLIMTSYTVIDPITIILFVRDYREAVSCAHRKYLPNAQVAQSASAKLSLNTNVHFANPVSAPSC